MTVGKRARLLLMSGFAVALGVLLLYLAFQPLSRYAALAPEPARVDPSKPYVLYVVGPSAGLSQPDSLWVARYDSLGKRIQHLTLLGVENPHDSGLPWVQYYEVDLDPAKVAEIRAGVECLLKGNTQYTFIDSSGGPLWGKLQNLIGRCSVVQQAGYGGTSEALFSSVVVDNLWLAQLSSNPTRYINSPASSFRFLPYLMPDTHEPLNALDLRRTIIETPWLSSDEFRRISDTRGEYLLQMQHHRVRHCLRRILLPRYEQLFSVLNGPIFGVTESAFLMYGASREPVAAMP